MHSDGPESLQARTSVAVAMPATRTHVVLQFVKFGTVGISNTLLTFAVYTVLLKVFGVWYLAASAIGFVVGATNGFLLNRRWTFKGHVGDALTPVRWAVVQGVGLGLNEGLLFLLVHQASLDELVGQACATAVVTVLTFFANRAWTFRMHHHDGPPQVPAGEARAGEARGGDVRGGAEHSLSEPGAPV
jgi:putative flippase GtrA